MSATRARHAAWEYAEGTGVDLEAVSIAVAEAVGNAIIHGYRNGRFGLIRMRIHATADELVVSVADRGRGMAPNPSAEGLGIGLSLIRKVCDHVDIASSPSGTRIAMCFRAVQPA